MKSRAFAVAALLLVAGCGGAGGTSSLPHQNGTTAQAPTASMRSPISSTGGATPNGSLFHPNTIKYSDKGSHPATGRSGSAVIQSRALLAKDGTTLVEATTGVLDGQVGVGSFSRVQTKLRTVDGVPRRALNYNNLSGGGYWSQTYSGMARNDSVEVTSHVVGADPARTDVITTIDTVKRRPDLAALRLTGPSRAYVRAPVSFTADVAELNGDVGARADCVLAVDGQQVDQSLGIWVDAGHTVACAFQTSFATTGTKKVTVSVTNVVPGDWDLSNNTAQTTIEIVDPVVQIGYAVYAEDWNGTYSWYDKFSDPWSGYSDNAQQTFRGSNTWIIGRTAKHRFQFPIQQLSAKITADGAPIVQQTFTSFSPPYDSYYYTCSATYSAGAYGSVCTLHDRYGVYSDAYFVSYTEVVTYYSQYAEYGCASFGCTTGYSYVYNQSDSGSYTNGTGGGTFDIGSTDQFTLNLTDASGTTYRAATPPLPVQSYSYGPYTWGGCESYWWNGGTYCFSETSSLTRKSVFAQTPWGDF